MRNLGIGLLYLICGLPGTILVAKLVYYYLGPTTSPAVRLLGGFAVVIAAIVPYVAVTYCIDRFIFNRAYYFKRWMGKSDRD